MTTRDDSQGAETLDLEALDWVVRLTVGQVSAADWSAFELWRMQSVAHDAAFAAASDLCGHLRRMPLDIAPDTFADAGGVLPFAPAAHRPAAVRTAVSRRAFMRGGGALAASLAGGMLMSRPPLDLWPSLAELMADERTERGQRHSFSPVEGVSVELNSRSSASRVDGGDGMRLVSGEAYVAVRDLAEPFRVGAGGVTLSTRDAAFNVQSRDEAVCVTCVRGTVDAVLDGRRERIGAGGELLAVGDGTLRGYAADPVVRLAWRRGLLILRRTPVSEAVPQINRYFPGRLVITDSSKSDWPVSGVFHIDHIELAVIQLQRLLDMKATRLPGGVVLLG